MVQSSSAPVMPRRRASQCGPGRSSAPFGEPHEKVRVQSSPSSVRSRRPISKRPRASARCYPGEPETRVTPVQTVAHVRESRSPSISDSEPQPGTVQRPAHTSVQRSVSRASSCSRSTETHQVVDATRSIGRVREGWACARKSAPDEGSFRVGHLACARCAPTRLSDELRLARRGGQADVVKLPGAWRSRTETLHTHR